MEGDRVAMVNMSSAEGQHFAQFATEFTELVRSLGPSPVKSKKLASPAKAPAEAESVATA